MLLIQSCLSHAGSVALGMAVSVCWLVNYQLLNGLQVDITVLLKNFVFDPDQTCSLSITQSRFREAE